MKSVTFSEIERVRKGPHRPTSLAPAQRRTILLLSMVLGLPALTFAFHLVDPTAPLGYIVVPVLLGGLLPAIAPTLPGRFEVTTRFSACHLVGTVDDAMESLGYAPAERSPGTVRYRMRAARWSAGKNADITVTVRDHMLEVAGPVRTLHALRQQLSC
ncbi:hypothetical protein GPY61_15925 [Massilia sp. NEAU-DD11]|uniref:Uncharacterized protein n=1 Tax=Massilia cellulosiltytica TaxID=2683234 RepID=A0A7X3G0J8_9BURK|nr:MULTISPECIES: hypothetical protein [Telluria group]MVW61419.1 hypothetical protein [Telluria cellulosilytica]